MCPCPVCATLAFLLAPFLGYKWVKKLLKKHHCNCEKCQTGEQGVTNHGEKTCSCAECCTQKDSAEVPFAVTAQPVKTKKGQKRSVGATKTDKTVKSKSVKPAKAKTKTSKRKTNVKKA